jgi:hypothetical protein
MSMEQLVEWELAEEIDYPGENLSQCRYVYHNIHIIWDRIEPWPPRWEAGDSDTAKEHYDGDNCVLGSFSSPYMYYYDDKINKEQTSKRVACMWERYNVLVAKPIGNKRFWKTKRKL